MFIPPAVYTAIALLSGPTLYLLTLHLLSVHSDQVLSLGKPLSTGDIWASRIGGLLSATFVLLTTYVWEPEDALTACGLRVVYFFAACKILDLAVARAAYPPKFLAGPGPKASGGASVNSKARGLQNRGQFHYAWHLLSEMRYHSFDIQPRQKNRQPHSEIWTWGPIVFIPLASYLFPIMQMKCLFLLLVIRHGLEIGHFIVHPHCGDPFFWYPFAASSMTGFWTNHWHSCAEPFLRTLAYEPASQFLLYLGFNKQAAKAGGVIAGFSLSGLWHGWAASVLSTSPYVLGFRVWTLFVGMGMVCILENLIWAKERQGNSLQRIFVWVYALSHAAWCWNFLQDTSKVPWLAEV